MLPMLPSRPRPHSLLTRHLIHRLQSHHSLQTHRCFLTRLYCPKPLTHPLHLSCPKPRSLPSCLNFHSLRWLLSLLTLRCCLSCPSIQSFLTLPTLHLSRWPLTLQ